MKKIKIGTKGFPTTHYGYMAPGAEVEVSEDFAKFCVERMKAAAYVNATPVKKRSRPKKTVQAED